MSQQPIWVGLAIALLGGTEVWRFVQWIIHRKDKKTEKDDEILKELRSLKGRVDAIAQSAADDRATNARIRILSFSDEVRHGVRHSKEAFDQVNLDIDMYKAYCHSHPDYQNNRGHMAIENIERVYAECLRNNDFLE